MKQPTKTRKVEFIGTTTSDVQGIGLREEIQKLALTNTPQIKGFVQNVKGAPIVKVQIIDEDRNHTNSFVKMLEEKVNEHSKKFDHDAPPVKKDIADETVDIDAEEYASFKVVREDDLTEMVWALQGAGKTFGAQTKLLLKWFEERDRKKNENLKVSLQAELSSISDQANQMVSNKMKNAGLPVFSIERALTDMPFDADGLRTALHDLHFHCREANQRMQGGETSNELNEFLTTIIRKAGYVEELLNKETEQPGK